MISSYLVIGALAGIMSGLLGIGGGIVVVPALSAIFFHQNGIPKDSIMHMAIGTSLAIMVVTLLASTYAHQKHGAIDWTITKKMLPALLLGSVIGAVVAHFLPSYYLSVLFSLFLLVMGVRFLFKAGDKAGTKPLSNVLMKGFAGLIGALSSILGAGGGAMMVPLLLHCQLDMVKAIGTSVACVIGVALVATICFMLTGLYSMEKLPWSTGYIYWPAFMGISVASMLFAPVGAVLAHRLPSPLLKRIFGIFLLVMAVDMIFFSQ